MPPGGDCQSAVSKRQSSVYSSLRRVARRDSSPLVADKLHVKSEIAGSAAE